MQRWPVGLFTSIDGERGVDLAIAKEIGIPTLQIYAPKKSNRSAKHAKEFLARLADFDITLTAVFGGFAGESYADIPTVVKTVGLVPAETRAERLVEMKEISDFSKMLGCNVIALHLGFVPHQRESILYQEVIAIAKGLCQYAAANGQALHLETGQETAEALNAFIDDVDEGNLFVNFDPANMILYGTQKPIEALRALGTRVRSCHFKDATWSDKPGETWGTEISLGQGDVDIQKYIDTLNEIGYGGALTIECEIPIEPERQKQEIGQAVKLIERCRP